MIHWCRFGFLLASAASVFTAGIAPAAAQEVEPRFSLVDLDGYQTPGVDEGFPLYPFDLPGGEVLYRSTGPLGTASTGGSTAPPGPAATHGEVPSAWQFQEPGAPSPVASGHYTQGVSPRSNEISLGLFVAQIDGAAAEGDVPSEFDYDDIFTSGKGFRLLWRLHVNRASTSGNVFSWGPLAMIDYTRYEGDKITLYDDFLICPYTMEFDDMSVTKLMGGMHFRNAISNFFFGLHVGLGLAIISEVDVELDDSFCSGIPGDVYEFEFYSETITYALDLELRLGAKWDFPGSATGMAFYVLMGAAYNGAPDEGRDVISLDADPITQLYLGLGFSVEFGGAPTALLQ